jgi:phosphoribosylformimino-5-aminoimidazole carboxamide ribotide isomerase
MLIIPAIDLLGGKCVRLLRGAYASARVYDDDPVAVARELERSGALWIHIVDLDAARGSGSNRTTVARIREAVSCRLQTGGGIRAESDVRELAALGIDRLVVGTVLARTPELVAQWNGSAPGRIVAGIDAHEGEVRVAGWEESGALADTALAAAARGYGVHGIVYTSIARDGTMAGPDVARTNAVAAAGLPVLLSGGVGSDEDVARVQAERAAGVAGVIIGKALYERRVDLAGLIRRYQGKLDSESW